MLTTPRIARRSQGAIALNADWTLERDIGCNRRFAHHDCRAFVGSVTYAALSTGGATLVAGSVTTGPDQRMSRFQ